MTDFDDLTTELRPIIERHAASLVVSRDKPGEYQLETTRVGPSGTRLWFGAIQARAKYVSVHLMPLASHPDLMDGVSDDLRALMQGRTTFNLTDETVTPELIAELSALADAGLARYRADGLA
jgi:hypothetical protein